MNQPSKSLKELIEEYLAKNRGLKSSTRDHRKIAWQHLIDAVSDIKVSEFTYNDAEDYQEHLYSKNLRAGAIESYIKAIRPVFHWAERRGYRQGDPFRGLKLPRIPQYEIHIYSEAELNAILAAAPLLWRSRIMAAVSAGLRRSEDLNLTINDVDFDRGYISVQAKKETRDTWAYSTKSYECRRVPLIESLANLFTKIIAELPAGQPYLHLTERQYWTKQHRRSEGIMGDRERLNPDENMKPFRKILNAVKIVGTFHDLRRTAISRWSWNLAPQETQKLAGHAELETTMKYYAACRPDVLQRANECSIV